jgi:ketosteroid isomerase-like protein
VSAHHPNPPDPERDELEPDQAKPHPRNDRPIEGPIEGPVEGKEVEEFFQRLPGNFRWPKPNAEAVAAAVEAIHRISGSQEAQDREAAGDADQPGTECSECGGSLPAGARFCVWCGIPAEPSAADTAAPLHSRAGAQHHVHHHYHHLVPSQGTASGGPAAESQSSAPRGSAPGSAGGSAAKSAGGRAEAGARQVVQDWAQACNTKHIDDLLELYAADATLIRSSVPPVRSLPAIREFLVSLLEAGLGDVEMESLRVEVMGEIALDLGRCKMLVPVAMGKRREERGKYLIVLVRQPAGTWKILADCWSADLTVSAPTLETAARKGSEPIPPVRKPR